MKTESTTIIKSLFMSHAEKITTLESNTIYLKQVVNFFSCKDKRMSRCSSLDILNNQLVIYLKELTKTKKHIDKRINSINDKTSSKTTTSHLIEYDKISQKITTFIEVFYKSISKKVFQIKEESFYDYIPRPIVGRIFSSKAFLDHIETSYNDLIHYYLDDDFNVIYFWDYINNYTENSLTEKNGEYFFAKEELSKTDFIQLAFWYHDAMNIPLITHEIGHMITTKKKTEKNELFFKIKNNLNQRLNNATHTKNTTLSIIKGYESKISEEIVADLFSLMCHKQSYIVSLFHVLIGRNFSETFVNDNITILQWEYKRDFSITRLWILMFIWEEYLIQGELEESKDQKAYTGLKDILDNLYNISNESYSGDLFKVYNTNYANLSDGYTLISNSINKIIHITLEVINEVMSDYDICKTEFNKNIFEKDYYDIKVRNNPLDLVNESYINLGDLSILHSLKLLSETSVNEIRNLDGNHTPINQLKFGDLWKKRYFQSSTEDKLEIINTQYFFRSSMFNNDDKFSKSFKIGNAFELKYYKIGRENFGSLLNSKEFKKSNNDQIIKNIINEINMNSNKYSEKEKTLNASFLFDVYDYVVIKEELNQKEFIYDSNKQVNSTLKFYTYNHSLIEILPKSKKAGDYISRKDDFISILMHIQLYENNISSVTSISEQLFKLIKDKPFRVFKSLGPKDIVVQIEYINLNDVFLFKDMIGNLDEVRRTFTSIYLNDLYDNEVFCSENDKLEIYSVLRLKKNMDTKGKIDWKNEFKKDPSLSVNIKHLVVSSGVTDLEIVWKSFSIDIFNKLIDMLSSMNMLSDIQNKIRNIDVIEFS